MLKAIGLFATAILVSLQLTANPIQVNNQVCSYSMEFSGGKGSSIPASTVDLLLKESAKQLQVPYADLCIAYDKEVLTIKKITTNLGQAAYEVVFGSCSLCILEDDIL